MTLPNRYIILDTYPQKQVFKLPLFVPLPFCGQTFQDVNYSLLKFDQSWLTIDKDNFQIVLAIDSKSQAPTKDQQVCIVAGVP